MTGETLALGQIPVARGAANNFPVQKVQGNNNKENKSPEKIDTDAFESSFSYKQAGKNFLKGLASPIKAIIDNPLLSIGMLVAGAALIYFVPVLLPVLVVGGLAFGLFELGKGVIGFATAAVNGDNKEMENSFKDIGTGIISTLLSLIGVRSTAVIAAEAKAASVAIRAGKSAQDAVKIGMEAAKKAKSLTYLQALKENLSIFSRSGICSIRNNFGLKVKGLCSLKDNLCTKASKISKTLRLIRDGFKEVFYPKNPQLKQRVNAFYEREITEMAKRLGVSEDKLKLIVPKIKLFSINLPIGGSIIKPPGGLKHRFILNIKALFEKDAIHNFVAHETRHLEQCYFELMHLSRKNFVTTYTQAFKNECLSTASNPSRARIYFVELFGKIIGTMKYVSKGRLTKAGIRVRSTKEQVQQAQSLLVADAKCIFANKKLFLVGDDSAYLNNLLEVDARMYSMFRRLEILKEESKVSSSLSNSKRLELRSKLSRIQNELFDEADGFINPSDLQLKNLRDCIRTLVKHLNGTI